MFHDVAFIEVKPLVEPGKKGTPSTVAVELTNFSVFYSQDANTDAEQRLKNRGSRIIVDKGQIVKVSRDANGSFRPTKSVDTRTGRTGSITGRWILTSRANAKSSASNILRLGEWEEQWTGDYIFENEWQSFRTKKDRSLGIDQRRPRMHTRGAASLP